MSSLVNEINLKGLIGVEEIIRNKEGVDKVGYGVNKMMAN